MVLSIARKLVGGVDRGGVTRVGGVILACWGIVGGVGGRSAGWQEVLGGLQ